MVVLTASIFYGIYGLTQRAQHLRTELENRRLKAGSERQRRELQQLNNRVEKEDTSRKLPRVGVVQGSAHGLGRTGIAARPNGGATLQSKVTKLETTCVTSWLCFARSYVPTIVAGRKELEGVRWITEPFSAGRFFTQGKTSKRGVPVCLGCSGKFLLPVSQTGGQW